jgi:aryl sulfotransferase
LDAVTFPQKTREMHNHHFDSTVWNDFRFRDDDIVIATYGKSGTTWTQQIVGQLIFGGAEGVPIHELSPWIDLRVPPKEVKLAAVEAQQHRRFLKTHLPVDALVFNPAAKYIFVARDGRDVVWSFYNHHLKANDKWYQAINDTPGRVGPPIDPVDCDVVSYFRRWLEKDGYPFWSMWEVVKSWWAVRSLPNVLLVHYTDLKRDPEGQMRRIAGFLDIAPDEDTWDRIRQHCSFDYMKRHADEVTPLGGAVFEGGGKSFINQGVNGRWSGLLTDADNAAYEARARDELGRDCARWLESGGMV